MFRIPNVVLSLILIAAPVLSAEHIAPLPEIQEKAAAASESRQRDVARLRKFFASDPVRNAMRRTRMDAGQVTKAIPVLSDDDLARLAQRATAAESDFTAGALSNQELTYIVIALATAVLILVIVAA